ncbi:MAG: peroxiredoxin, partial [Chloroflexi bacterium]
IHIRYIVRGRGLKEKKVRRAIEMSETTFCSASAMLGKTAKIDYTYEIIEEGEHGGE